MPLPLPLPDQLLGGTDPVFTVERTESLVKFHALTRMTLNSILDAKRILLEEPSAETQTTMRRNTAELSEEE